MPRDSRETAFYLNSWGKVFRYGPVGTHRSYREAPLERGRHLRANSNYASNEYFLPVMGLIFLRHAYSRYLGVKDEIEANLPDRGGKKRALTKEDFSQKSSIFLRPQAQFDSLVALTDSDDRAKAIIKAMEAIEADYENLRGVLPKRIQELDYGVLGHFCARSIPRNSRPPPAMFSGASTSTSLPSSPTSRPTTAASSLRPSPWSSSLPTCWSQKGTVFDPACGSGGMFVQSARFVEQRHQNPRQAHLPWLRKKQDHRQSGQDEPCGPRPRRRHPAGHHLLRRPAQSAAMRFRHGQSAFQCG